MRTKTIFVILITALLTVFLMVNRDPVDFDFIIGAPVPVSKLLVIGVCIVIGFILGVIVARPKKTISSYDPEIEKNNQPENTSSLSDEDRDYIS